MRSKINRYNFFEHVPPAPLDPILGLARLFAEDKRPKKINLGIGTYLDEEGYPRLLNAVAEAEKRVVAKGESKEYLPIEGNKAFLEVFQKLLLGEASNNKVFSLQTVGGTGALRLAGEFLFRFFSSQMAISTPSWSNHEGIFKNSGFNIARFSYYDTKNHTLKFNEMLDFIESFSFPFTLLLQVNGHNPTGSDLTRQQWIELAAVVKKKRPFILFDNAYQGFVEGIEEDVFPLKYFMQEEIEFAAAVSLSKNFGLYGERVGGLLWHIKNSELKQVLLSQLKVQVRTLYSNPPRHGAAIVTEILQDEKLCLAWQKELTEMRKRIKKNRQLLVDALSAYSKGESFNYLKNEVGFFSLLNLTEEEVIRLRHEHGIYMLSNGRINFAGLMSNDIEFVAKVLCKIF